MHLFFAAFFQQDPMDNHMGLQCLPQRTWQLVQAKGTCHSSLVTVRERNGLVTVTCIDVRLYLWSRRSRYECVTHYGKPCPPTNVRAFVVALALQSSCYARDRLDPAHILFSPPRAAP